LVSQIGISIDGAGQLHRVIDPHFAKYSGAMRLNRSRGNAEFHSDQLVGLAISYRVEHLTLSFGQAIPAQTINDFFLSHAASKLKRLAVSQTWASNKSCQI
jgi:hypothetical protein